MHEAGQKRCNKRGKTKEICKKFQIGFHIHFHANVKGASQQQLYLLLFPIPLTTTHLIGDPGVLVVIRLFGGYGQHGGVGLLGPLIIQIRVVLIVPGLRRQVLNPSEGK